MPAINITFMENLNKWDQSLTGIMCSNWENHSFNVEVASKLFLSTYYPGVFIVEFVNIRLKTCLTLGTPEVN